MEVHGGKVAVVRSKRPSRNIGRTGMFSLFFYSALNFNNQFRKCPKEAKETHEHQISSSSCFSRPAILDFFLTDRDRSNSAHRLRRPDADRDIRVSDADGHGDAHVAVDPVPHAV